MTWIFGFTPIFCQHNFFLTETFDALEKGKTNKLNGDVVVLEGPQDEDRQRKMTQFSQLEYLLTLRKAQPNFLQHHSFFCQRRWVIYFQTMCILQRERIYHLTRMWYDDMLLIIKSPPPSPVLTNYYYTYYSTLCKSDDWHTKCPFIDFLDTRKSCCCYLSRK